MASADHLHFVLLEDDPLDAELIQEHVRASGLQVSWTRAVNESQFESALHRNVADLILSDFSLPGYDGLEAFELAYSLRPSTPFVFVSGAIGEELAIETLRRGAADYVLKDRLHYLPAAIHRALRLTTERKRRESAEAERDRLLISERRAREQAETANRMKDEFLATASHELRTPLNAILGWAKLLRNDSSNRDLLTRGLATIERNAVAQSRLIEDILDISRIVTGKVQVRLVRTSAAAIVGAVVDSLRPAATAKHIDLQVQTEGVSEIEADADRLQQVLWNLLSNAIKFTSARGRVVVTATQDAESLTLVVADTGQGIDPEVLPRVFDQFWQADSSATRRHKGLGLGLSIVRYLVELHGGEAWAESDGLGHGARFFVRIPAAAPPMAPRDSEQSGGRPRTPLSDPSELRPLSDLRVLVIDDDADAREIASLILSQRGATVITAPSASEGLACLTQALPNVLVCDIGMPDVDGYGLIRAVRSLPRDRGGDTPAIALTAFARELDREKAIDAGYQLHLAKPLSPSTLIQAIHQLLHARD